MSQESPSGPGRIALISALAGAAATIIAAIITVLAGAVHISITAPPTAVVTHTTTVAPSISTGTSTQSPGGRQDVRVWNMTVPYPYADLSFDAGKVTAFRCCSDAYYEPSSDTKIPQLRINVPYSLGVANANSSKQQCLTAINQQPNFNPITNLHKGLLICVQANGGVALLDQTQSLGQSDTLHLREEYWPNPGQ